MSQVFIDGEYVSCSGAQLAEIDQRASEANQKKPGSATRESMAAKVLGLKVAKKKGAK